MSYKSANVDRNNGGPGSSHQNADKPTPLTKNTKFESNADNNAGQGKTADHKRNTHKSAVSGGGGEQDSHHTHNSAMK